MKDVFDPAAKHVKFVTNCMQPSAIDTRDFWNMPEWKQTRDMHIRLGGYFGAPKAKTAAESHALCQAGVRGYYVPLKNG